MDYMFDNTMTISVSAPAPDSDEFGSLDMAITMTQDATLNQLMNNFQRIALALTYSHDTWRKVIIEMAEEYKTELNKEQHRA